MRAVVSALALVALYALLTACSTTTVKSTTYTPLEQESEQIREALLLDLGVMPFDPGLDDAGDDPTLRPEVRNAEARYFATRLSDTLQQSGAWGPVRVIPGNSTVVDVYVKGTILHSDGERLEIHIDAWDTTGRIWLDQDYEEVASIYAYDSRRAPQRDPFQGLFNRIANDLRQHRSGLTEERLTTLRTVSELRFAREFSPDSYSDHLEENRKGEIEVARLPAANDPIMARIDQIRERDYLFIDTLQEYYAGFADQMDQPYQQWRRESYQEVQEVRDLKRKSTAGLIGGAAAVVAGVAAVAAGDSSTQLGGIVAAGAGGMLIKDALAKRQEAEMHIATLEEMGESLEADIEPHVIDLEDRTITLTGNAEAQYDQWRELLKQIYDAERGNI